MADAEGRPAVPEHRCPAAGQFRSLLLCRLIPLETQPGWNMPAKTAPSRPVSVESAANSTWPHTTWGRREWVPGVSGKASPCGRSHHAWPPGVSREQSTSHPQPFRELQPDLAQETPDAAAFGTSSALATCSDTPEGFSYLATNSPRSGFNSISFTDSEKRIKDCSLPQGLGSLSSCPQESRLIKQCFLLFGYPLEYL